MNKKVLLLTAGGLTILSTVASCATPPSTPDRERQIGMANPAAVYCLSRHGQLDNIQTEKGTVSYCTLPNGERIDEWKLFHRDAAKK